jgi:hypothetical protein
MSEKPILFTVEMVKAILEGRKTVTRRVIDLPDDVLWDFTGVMKDGSYRFSHQGDKDLIDGLCFRKPRYQVGDLLWVKEGWWDLGHMEHGKWQGRIESHTVKPRYVADCPDPFAEGIGGIVQPEKIPWKQTRLFRSTWRKCSSRFMPKWVARTWLEVVSVRAERLQDITEDEIWAEGLCPTSEDLAYLEWINLWDSINAKRGYSWEINPWCWVLSFKQVKP